MSLRSSQRFNCWWIFQSKRSFVTLLLVVLSALSSCAKAPYNINDPRSRREMIIDTQLALTTNDCVSAIEISKLLYYSKYSDNEIRMLYASAQACNAGVILYDVLDELLLADLSNADTIFRSLVRIFPSRTSTDSRFQSAVYSVLSLQTILKTGVVVGVADSIKDGEFNPGSLLTRDRTSDANTFLVFISMASIGTALNRYGFNSNDDPATLNYAQQVNLPWTTRVLVQGDTTNAACDIASGFLNMTDSINAVVALMDGSTASVLSSINSILVPAITLAMNNRCTADGGTALQCSVAQARLRYRGACQENAFSASSAAGVIEGINAGWN